MRAGITFFGEDAARLLDKPASLKICLGRRCRGAGYFNFRSANLDLASAGQLDVSNARK
jgi:hypothetical protein